MRGEKGPEKGAPKRKPSGGGKSGTRSRRMAEKKIEEPDAAFEACEEMMGSYETLMDCGAAPVFFSRAAAPASAASAFGWGAKVTSLMPPSPKCAMGMSPPAPPAAPMTWSATAGDARAAIRSAGPARDGDIAAAIASLVARQQADGSWKCTGATCTLLQVLSAKLTLSTVKSAIPAGVPSPQLWVTALVLVAVEAGPSSAPDGAAWEGARDKAAAALEASGQAAALRAAATLLLKTTS